MIAVYVAGASAEIERAEHMIATLRALGVVVTHDWPARMRAMGPEHLLTRPVLADELRACLAGVRRADVLLLLEPTRASTGAWVELGYAAGLGTVEIVSCGADAPSPWVDVVRPLRSFASDEIAAAWFVVRPLRGFRTDDEAARWLGARVAEGASK